MIVLSIKYGGTSVEDAMKCEITKMVENLSDAPI